MKIRHIDINSEEYPAKLREIANPPKELYYSGDISLLSTNCVAMVGSRKFTMYGKTVARSIGRTLASAGMTVVSGLAKGIDTFSHEGALEVDGKAIAVLGTGILRMFPTSNQQIMNEIADSGLVISEFEPNFSGNKWSFPSRNRIISGLSETIVVIEANFQSGALITANFALEQGKNLYAVPGNITSQFSAGTNRLIRDGATPLICVKDILDELGLEQQYETEDVRKILGEDELAVYNCVKNSDGITVNEIAHMLDTKTAKVNATITVLEIKGVLTVYAGKIFIAK
ncbi:MAG: DNA-protecting protein DprA [Clostridiales bacterium]|nr:DNA-protecting protein DprA [Clostridiales bacterium]